MFRYFDLHCDTPYRCFCEKLNFDDSALAVNLSKDYFSTHKQCFAFWIKDDIEQPYLYYKSMLSDFSKKLSDSKTSIIPYLTVEGGALIEHDIDRVYELSRDGIRSLGLTWNGKNLIASGIYADGGVTEFGSKVISAMNELRIPCDLSHLNTESYYDACALSYKPFVSHTGLSSVCLHPRNITDEQIDAVCSRNGVIGICFYPLFLGGEDVFEAFYRNIFCLLDKGYENNISIGSDFDGADMNIRLSNTSQVVDLYAFLTQKGIDDNLIDKIFYKNAEDFFSNL